MNSGDTNPANGPVIPKTALRYARLYLAAPAVQPLRTCAMTPWA